jgi:3-hydroxy-9,10-secoandrosta-1,3,5(10)-triene-9,17-dione monooxygenase reductase component
MASACATASDRAPAEAGVIDPARFRRTLSTFGSGVVIVTGALEGRPSGFACQSFFSLSLDPPLVAFAPARTSTSYPEIRGSGAFCINVLGEDQLDLCRRFAKSGPEKWTSVDWRPGVTGSPVLPNSLAAIECRLEQEIEAGDHYLVIGRVVDIDHRNGNPLIFFAGRFTGVRNVDA